MLYYERVVFTRRTFRALSVGTRPAHPPISPYTDVRKKLPRPPAKTCFIDAGFKARQRGQPVDAVGMCNSQ